MDLLTFTAQHPSKRLHLFKATDGQLYEVPNMFLATTVLAHLQTPMRVLTIRGKGIYPQVLRAEPIPQSEPDLIEVKP